MSIELHCHTLFSVDGYETPETLVEAAAARGVTVLSITEHNHLGSTGRAAGRAKELGIRYIPGVEIDAYIDADRRHVLAYGINPEHAGLRSLVERNHTWYARRGESYYGELRALGFPWERQEILDHMPVRYPTHPAPVFNTYLIDQFADSKGGVPGFPEMRAEAVRRMAVDRADSFCRFEEARDAVHAAGGRLLLAHVGYVLPGRHAEQEALIRRLVDTGLDGFELYHPRNVTNCDLDRLAELGRELGCLLSGGSDCHRAPGTPPREIGGCGAPDDLLDNWPEC